MLYNTNTRMKTILFSLALLFIALAEIPHLNKQQITEKIDTTKLFYGSTIRIKAAAFPF